MYVPGSTIAQSIPTNFLELYGHSFFYLPSSTGATITSTTTDQTGSMASIFASGLGLTPLSVRNHAVTASSLTQPGRNQCGYARVLADLQRRRQTFPFVRSGGTYVGCWGINDIGNYGAGATVQARFQDGLRMFISRARSSATYLTGNGAPWTLGTNFTAAAATFLTSTSGKAMRATAIDSAGTSTATFTIPLGYKGEPIAFAFLCSSGATGGDITWGGTVTGTSGIISTVTSTDSGGVGGNYGLICKRFTAAANGLSAHNAGQTITLKVTRVSASGEVILDSAWIEAFKPDPVIVCNVSRLACHNYTLAFGDVATTAASTTITSNIAQFASGTDVGNPITETDAQGAFTAGKTIASVTNATTAVLSATAAATKTNVEVTLQRTLNGYKNNYSGNANFTAATPASHVAADNDVLTCNGWISSVVAEFDAMVSIADLDTAIGQDANLPATLNTYYSLADGLHPNEMGNMRCAQAMFDAIQAFAPVDPISLPELELAGSPAPVAGAVRRPRPSSWYVTAEYGSWGSTYTAVAGDMFAIPIMVTEPAENWNNMAIQQTNAPTTAGSNVRCGIYEDAIFSGYPRSLVIEATSSAFAMGTTAGVKTMGFFGWNILPGLYWLVFKIDSLGTTASVVNQINGPNPYLPAWASNAGGTSAFIGYKLTGQAAGILPLTFPTGGTLVTAAPAVMVQVS